jgi:ribonuclease BN (tRNA processing enzyme)
MEITILGSGTSIPSNKRSSPSILVNIDDHNILLDTGPGSLRQLKKNNTSLNQIDTIIYSHFHIDHISDMLPFIFSSKYNPEEPRTTDLEIIGPMGLKKLYNDLLHAHGKQIVPDSFKIEWIEMAESCFKFDKFIINTCKVMHTDNSIAIKLTDTNNKTVVYSGDTDYCAEIIDLARDCDLLILECSFPDNLKVKGHLTPSETGRIASQASANKLLLTHFYPQCDLIDIITPVKDCSNGDIIAAEDLLKISI